MGATNPNAGGAPGGGGKGGMGMNRGPGGNAQNNPGGPQANYGMGMNPGMPAFNLPHSYGGGGPNGPSNLTSISGMGFPGGGREQTIEDLVRMEKGWGVGGGGGNLTPPTPQPQEPIGGYIGGQPAQFHYQAQNLNQPRTNKAGLPSGGLLSRLYGG